MDSLEWRDCKSPGCPKSAAISGFCKTHYVSEYSKTHVPIAAKNRRGRITDAEKAEIKKRSSRFQSNYEIVKATGVSLSTVRRVLSKTKRITAKPQIQNFPNFE